MLLSCRLQETLRKLLFALRPYVKEGSGKWPRSFCYGSTKHHSQGHKGLLGRRDRDWTILAGVDALCHKKKATFWRKLAESFPQLIDFLCNPDDLGQVSLGWPRTGALFSTLRVSFFQGALLTGLDGFYRTYMASESDTSNREEQDATINSVLHSCVRFQFRGAVRSPRYAAFRYFPLKTFGTCRGASSLCAKHVVVFSLGRVLSRQRKRGAQKALRRGRRARDSLCSANAV